MRAIYKEALFPLKSPSFLHQAVSQRCTTATSQRQNPQDFPIFMDNTATPAAGAYPLNTIIPATLHPVANNQQRERRPNDPWPATNPLHMLHWWV